RFDPRSMPYRSLCEFLTKQAHLLESAAVLLRSTVANARERRNDDQLSHPLPTELLYLIFTYLISDRALECNTDLVHASHVCRRWRTAALGNSSLWTLFDVNGSRRMHDKAQAFMERSGDKLIDVYCSRGPRRISVPPILEGLLPVSKKSHLILSLIINRRDELMAPLFLQSIWAEGFASHLRTLHILGSENIPERHGDPFASIAVNGLRMFEENISGDPRWTPTPLLRSLRLHGFHLHWNSPAYRNLTELELRIPDVEPPSQRQLLRILKACPDLRRLDLRLSGIAGPFVAAAHRVWDVSLPNLDTLSLNMPPPASIATVLEHLILPPTTRYSL
ncbi:uncharacterized protein BXZ73DRAFT_21143, partial [Epithele typhae]|uniref:uncharacterized protein n=1 Tax=Epithele typhae TaxID=378194 RepID=UPI002008D135